MSAGATEAAEISGTSLKRGDTSCPFKKDQTPPVLGMKIEKP